jgi:hypothetical protein
MTDTGARPRANFREWRTHVIGRLANQIENSADRLLMNLFEELKAYPVPPGSKPYRPSGQARLGDIAIPLKLSTADGVLSFLSTTTVFGTALDITLSELAIECFFPADAFTADVMRRLGDGRT